MSEVDKIVVFKLGNEFYGVRISEIREIINKVEINKIPQMPSYMKGITNLRGKITIIYDLGESLGFGEREYQEKSKILISSESDTGFVVDDVAEIISIKLEEIDSVGSLQINNKLITGFVKANDRIISLVNFNSLIKNDEIDLITA